MINYRLESLDINFKELKITLGSKLITLGMCVENAEGLRIMNVSKEKMPTVSDVSSINEKLKSLSDEIKSLNIASKEYRDVVEEEIKLLERQKEITEKLAKSLTESKFESLSDNGDLREAKIVVDDQLITVKVLLVYGGRCRLYRVITEETQWIKNNG